MTRQDELIGAFRRGDPDAVADALLGMQEGERRSAYDDVIAELGGVKAGQPARDVAFTIQVAMLGTAGAKESRWIDYRAWWHGPCGRAADVLSARPDRVLAAQVRGLLRQEVGPAWFLVRDLVVRGRIERPVSDEYWVSLARGLVCAFPLNVREVEPATAAFLDRLRSEPALVEELWSALDTEAVADLIATPDVAWGTSRPHAWVAHLQAAAAEDILDRSRLLDLALAAQVRDLRPLAAGWFRRLFDALDPTSDEIANRSAALTRVLGAPHPAEQRAAIARLRGIAAAGGGLDGVTIAAALIGPPVCGTKATALDALRLLADLHLDPRTTASVALAALGHSHPDVQVAALRTLLGVSGGLDESERAQLIGIAPLVNPAHAGVVDRLLGMELPVSTPAAPTVDDFGAVVADLPASLADALGLRGALRAVSDDGRLDPLGVVDLPSGALPVRPVADVDELVELMVAALVGPIDGIDLERLMDGVARTARGRVPDVEVAPVRRLLERDGWTTEMFARNTFGQWWWADAPTMARHLIFCWAYDLPPERPDFMVPTDPQHPSGVLHDLSDAPDPGLRLDEPSGIMGTIPPGFPGFLVARMFEALAVSQAAPHPSLALPTTSDGRLRVQLLIDRIAACEATGVTLGRFELAAALLRVTGSEPYDADGLRRIRSAAGKSLRSRLREGDDHPEDEGLARAARSTDTTTSGVVVWMGPAPGPSYPDQPVLRFTADGPVPDRRRDDLVGQLLSDITTKPATPWPASNGRALPHGDALLVSWALSTLPHQQDLVRARAATIVLENLDWRATTQALHTVLAPCAHPSTWLGLGSHTLIAVSLAALDERPTTASADALIVAAEEGRLDPALLGRILAALTNARAVKITRVAKSLGPAASASDLAATAIVATLTTWLAELDHQPADLGAALDTLTVACDATHQGVGDARARQRLTEAATGASRRAKTARRLLGFDTTPSATASRLELRQRLNRAQRLAAAQPEMQ